MEQKPQPLKIYEDPTYVIFKDNINDFFTAYEKCIDNFGNNFFQEKLKMYSLNEHNYIEHKLLYKLLLEKGEKNG